MLYPLVRTGIALLLIFSSFCTFTVQADIWRSDVIKDKLPDTENIRKSVGVYLNTLYEQAYKLKDDVEDHLKYIGSILRALVDQKLPWSNVESNAVDVIQKNGGAMQPNQPDIYRQKRAISQYSAQPSLTSATLPSLVRDAKSAKQIRQEFLRKKRHEVKLKKMEQRRKRVEAQRKRKQYMRERAKRASQQRRARLLTKKKAEVKKRQLLNKRRTEKKKRDLKQKLEGQKRKQLMKRRIKENTEKRIKGITKQVEQIKRSIKTSEERYKKNVADAIKQYRLRLQSLKRPPKKASKAPAAAVPAGAVKRESRDGFKGPKLETPNPKSKSTKKRKAFGDDSFAALHRAFAKNETPSKSLDLRSANPNIAAPQSNYALKSVEASKQNYESVEETLEDYV